jgi:hypothetical protein
MTTVAKKRAQRSGTKKATKQRDARPKPAAKASRAKPAGGPAKSAARVSAPARQGAVSAPLLEQARSLREAIERSKQTATDPWGYTTKARGWLQRTDVVLVRIAASADAAGTRKTLEILRAEVEGDRDFREARRLF